MGWVETVHWIALFLAFLGPLLAYGLYFDWLVHLMFLLGVVVAIATYNSGVPQNAVLYLLLAGIALLLLPAISTPLHEYIQRVLLLSAWYVMPIALAQGWKALIG